MHYPTTPQLLEKLDAASGGKLTRRDDLAKLLLLGETEKGRQILANLGFHAKAGSRIHRMLSRIGREGEGYAALEKEFVITMDRTTTILSELLGDAPADVAGELRGKYLQMTGASLENRLALMYDLSWYKNWLIDSRHDPEGRP
jgi:hypothetical protein